jgi:hypothetical protein
MMAAVNRRAIDLFLPIMLSLTRRAMWVQESSFHFLDASAHDNVSETDLYPTKLFSVDMANRAVTSLAPDGSLKSDPTVSPGPSTGQWGRRH